MAPGLDTIFIVSNGIAGGAKIGFSCAFGVTVGTTFHIVLAIFGLSYLFQTYPVLGDIIRYLGGIYLIYVAVSTWINASEIKVSFGSNITVRTAIARGIVSSLLNPKIIIFIISFIPQFIPVNTNFNYEFFILWHYICFRNYYI